ncbi:MAG: AAA family ATPase [Deltaproteobacteria bacterium]|nr:AAA family ATPase [Deltaproteobacteria bacterium]
MPPTERHIDSALAALLHKRVLFFTGKGGVGKTTVASALALAAARAGKKTLLIEIGDNRRAARLLGLPAHPDSSNVLQEFSPALSVLSTSGTAALEEYLHLIIPVKHLVRLLVDSRPYQYFVAAAPGLKELLTLGKIWYEERRKDADTRQPRWDLLIVDLPATGHGLQYLTMPRAARDTFQDGVIHREAERIATWLQDAETTAVNVVTVAEELPVSETREVYRQLADTMHLPLGLLFVNRVHEVPLSHAFLARFSFTEHDSVPERQLAERIVAWARTEATLTEGQEIHFQQLRQLPLPLVFLPFCFAPEFGFAEVESLSLRLERALRQETSGHKPRTKRMTKSTTAS